ncbi:hypothetical protein [Flavisolibacter nicotianae]|uniref:hypothetical protein n=1 Tax=Flavisolibacter nicotianae TaxID=2364882 RepID=UPI000EB30A83|nr:hypothetical protein [Flavisolibacter nicotianae]
MLTVAVLFQGVLLLFHQVTTLFDFYPFNNVRQYTLKERLAECCVNGIIMAFPLAGFCLQIDWMTVTSLVIYPVLLLGEYLNWWRHYFFGPTEEWQQTYDRLFRHTIIVLPRIKDHPVPNLEHTLLHSLTLLTAIVTYIAYFTTP